MTFNYSDKRTLEDIKDACESNTKLQKGLLEAFNAQTTAIERQNELQEKTITALETIISNTAPKVRHVKPSNKTTQL